MKMLADWLILPGEPEFRVTSSRSSPSMHCKVGTFPRPFLPVFRYYCSINCLKWVDGHMDIQIYAQTMPGQIGKCVLGVIGSYRAGKVWGAYVWAHPPSRVRPPTCRLVIFTSILMAFFSQRKILSKCYQIIKIEHHSHCVLGTISISCLSVCLPLVPNGTCGRLPDSHSTVIVPSKHRSWCSIILCAWNPSKVFHLWPVQSPIMARNNILLQQYIREIR